MALDNAQFIAELSFTDPPGTDPLSQGDDQIRTAKRAVFQSFPFIDKEVSLTADQLNLAAIKNEINVFTANQQFDANILLNAAVDQVKSLSYKLADVNAWQLVMDDVAGGNDYELRRFDVLGAPVDEPWKVSFATGIVDFAQVPTVLGAPLWIAGELRMFASAAVPGTNWFKADGTNGTVNATDRWMQASGTGAAGNSLPPNLFGTAIATTTGSTALTVAQLAAHDHQILGSGTPGVLAGLQEANARAFAGLGSVTPAFIDQTGFGDNLMANTGSGSGHTHAQVQMDVFELGSGFNVVQPLTMIVDMFQYVP